MARNTRAELGVAHGLITGAAVGAVLLALTGSVWWIVLLPGLGLLIGLVVSAAAPRRGPEHRSSG